MVKTFVLNDLPNDMYKDKYCSDTFHNSSEELQVIKIATEEAAAGISADIIKVGEAFEKASVQGQPFQCFSTYTLHPTEYGSYMIACLFYKFFTGRKVSQLKYNANISGASAELIRKFVDELK